MFGIARQIQHYYIRREGMGGDIGREEGVDIVGRGGGVPAITLPREGGVCCSIPQQCSSVAGQLNGRGWVALAGCISAFPLVGKAAKRERTILAILSAHYWPNSNNYPGLSHPANYPPHPPP